MLIIVWLGITLCVIIYALMAVIHWVTAGSLHEPPRHDDDDDSHFDNPWVLL